MGRCAPPAPLALYAHSEQRTICALQRRKSVQRSAREQVARRGAQRPGLAVALWLRRAARLWRRALHWQERARAELQRVAHCHYAQALRQGVRAAALRRASAQQGFPERRARRARLLERPEHLLKLKGLSGNYKKAT